MDYTSNHVSVAESRYAELYDKMSTLSYTDQERLRGYARVRTFGGLPILERDLRDKAQALGLCYKSTGRLLPCIYKALAGIK